MAGCLFWGLSSPFLLPNLLQQVLLKDLDPEFASLGKELEGFFAEGDEAKMEHSSGALGCKMGYSSVAGVGEDGYSTGHVFKEKLSYVVRKDAASGSYVLPNGPPLDFPLPAMPAHLDRLQSCARDVVRVLAEDVFAMTPDQLGHKANVPFIAAPPGEAFALFDAAHYLNKHAKGVPPINCVSHYDPGLFALSVYSNAPGLQVMEQATKKFVDVPFGPGLGVVWAGDAAYRASDGGVARGIHRVVYPDNVGTRRASPRLTCWLELGVPAQLATYDLDYRETRNALNLMPELDSAVALSPEGGWLHALRKGLSAIAAPFSRSSNTLEQEHGLPMR